MVWKKMKAVWIRRGTVILAGFILLMSFAIKKTLSERKRPNKRRVSSVGEKSLKILTVKNRDIRKSVNVTGRLTALNKIEIYAEVSGILQKAAKPFKEGSYFSKGEILLKIDDKIARMNLLSQKSAFMNELIRVLPDLQADFPDSARRWEEYLRKFNLHQSTPPLPEINEKKQKYFLTARGIYTRYYNIKSQEATLAKYYIKAPFNGVLTESDLNPGAQVLPGKRLGEFINPDIYEMEAAVKIEALQELHRGHSVKLTSDDITGEFSGIIKRINKKIDRSSQTVNVYITCQAPELRDGMYMNAEITTRLLKNVFEIPKNLLLADNKVYILENALWVTREVEVVDGDENIAIIRGLENNTRLLGEPLPDHYLSKKNDNLTLLN